jgi:hypothetical protein
MSGSQAAQSTPVLDERSLEDSRANAQETVLVPGDDGYNEAFLR